ncbi:MAG: exopolysaccharide production repressor protein [Phyllobacterium sp.]
MTFPKFLAGFIGVLVAFAITTYAMTQSLWTTLVQTLICAVIIQVGYFSAVLFLVMREKAQRADTEKDTGLGVDGAAPKPPQPLKTSVTKSR